MVFFYLIIFVAAYALAASRAARYGSVRLWSTAAVSLLLIVAVGAFGARHYPAENLSRLLLYLIPLTGPIVIMPTALLARTATPQSTTREALPTAILGALLGLVCGYVMVVWGLGVW